jgi:hypothetical protein
MRAVARSQPQYRNQFPIGARSTFPKRRIQLGSQIRACRSARPERLEPNARQTAVTCANGGSRGAPTVADLQPKRIGPGIPMEEGGPKMRLTQANWF